jgi:hypothetical protein
MVWESWLLQHGYSHASFWLVNCNKTRQGYMCVPSVDGERLNWPVVLNLQALWWCSFEQLYQTETVKHASLEKWLKKDCIPPTKPNPVTLVANVSYSISVRGDASSSTESAIKEKTRNLKHASNVHLHVVCARARKTRHGKLSYRKMPNIKHEDGIQPFTRHDSLMGSLIG